MRTSDAVWAGAAGYTRARLQVYDFFIYGFNSPVAWKCPGEELLENYNRHVSGNHLDVGVGTGYLLDRCRFPTAKPRVFLMDLNPDALQVTAQRLHRFQPQTLRRNVLDPIRFDGEPFDSIGMNYLMHCVPGSIPEKAVMFDHLSALLKPGGVIFGSTVLSEGVDKGIVARAIMDRFNKKGIFSNTRDAASDLTRALEERFDDVSVRVVGCVGLFSARKRTCAGTESPA
uniref:JerF n=1 Tax=Sorangium cellulosum TaxID=56 RepID=A1YBT9_SORCE|nr:JerF [Sorangium cellulosum]